MCLPTYLVQLDQSNRLARDICVFSFEKADPRLKRNFVRNRQTRNKAMIIFIRGTEVLLQIIQIIHITLWI